VQGLANGDRADGRETEQLAHRRDVGVRAEHPAHVCHTLVGGALSCADQHVRLWIDSDDGPQMGGERDRELAGPTAEINSRVAVGQHERVHECLEHGCGIPTPVPLIELGDLAAEAQRHGFSMSADVLAEQRL